MDIFNGFLEMIITNAEKNSLKISPTLQTTTSKLKLHQHLTNLFTATA